MKYSQAKKVNRYFLFKKLRAILACLSLLALCVALATFTQAENLLPSMLRLPQVIFSLFTFFTPDISSLKYLGEIATSYFRSAVLAVSSTVFATCFALIAALFSSNVSKRGFFLPIVLRTLASAARNIPLPAQVILFLFSFGQNELTGFLVLFTLTFGSLTRIFCELIESTSHESFIALSTCGTSYTVALIHGILPNIEGQLLSWLLYAMATNIRDSALVGILTGSGIGFLFTLFFRSFRYQAAGLTIAVMLLTVLLFDFLANKLRCFMMSKDGSPSSLKARRLLSRFLFSFLLATAFISLFLIKIDVRNMPCMFISLASNIQAMFFSISVFQSLRSFSLFASCAVSIALATLATILSAFISLFIAIPHTSHLFCTKPLRVLRGIMDAFLSFIRSIPTIIWVMLFSVSLGVGATATIIGISLHSIAYLSYAFGMSFDEKARQASQALLASGAPRLLVFVKALLPSSLKDIMSWTFFRFEINFMNAVALGSAAGAGGIGYELFIAGSMEFDIVRVGSITYLLLLVNLTLEAISSHIKNETQTKIERT